ncbi:MAG TPA: GNAT family N-acetyltransferase [Pyrinomonadaceae bacterium]|nr:GNAT family N-acetyltransferase [Pyrinomonadaceae bacterium]
MKVTLKDIDRENFKQCVKLEVNEDQKNFVAPNVFSIAQSKVEPAFNVQAVYDGEEMVGFVMYGWDEEEGCHCLARLMVDKNQQGKGYGRAATEAVIERLRAEPGCKQIVLSVNPANTNAQALYESLGFVKTGEVSYGEEVMRLRFED